MQIVIDVVFNDLAYLIILCKYHQVAGSLNNVSGLAKSYW